MHGRTDDIRYVFNFYCVQGKEGVGLGLAVRDGELSSDHYLLQV